MINKLDGCFKLFQAAKGGWESSGGDAGGRIGIKSPGDHPNKLFGGRGRNFQRCPPAAIKRKGARPLELKPEAESRDGKFLDAGDAE
jgi:hypothetical protein